MLSVSQIKSMNQTIGASYTFGVFEKTTKELKDYKALNSVIAHTNKRSMDKYKSLVDYIFCETWHHPWKRRCHEFYDDRCVPLSVDPEFSSSERLWFDVAMSRLIVPICISVDSSSKVYKWRRIINNFRSYLIGYEVTLYSRPDFTQRRALQRVLDKQVKKAEQEKLASYTFY